MTSYPPIPHQPAPAPRRARRLPWVIAATAIVMAAAGVTWGLTRPVGGTSVTPVSVDTASSADGLEQVLTEVSFADPESTVRYVGERLAAHDPAGARQAFAIRSLVDTWDAAAALEHTGAFHLGLLPDGRNPQFRETFVAQRWADSMRELRGFTTSLAAPQWLRPGGYTSVFAPDGWTAAETIDAAAVDLSSLNLLRIADAERSAEPEGQRALQNLTKVAGVEETRQFVALWEFDGNTYYGGAWLLRDATGWRVYSLTSPLGSTTINGALEPIDVELYTEIYGP